MVGADRLYIQPLRRQHRERAPHGGSGQPHLIHRRAATVPGDSQGTALGEGERGAQFWVGTSSLMLGGRAVTERPVAAEQDARGPQLMGQPRDAWPPAMPRAVGLLDGEPLAVYKARSQVCVLPRPLAALGHAGISQRPEDAGWLRQGQDCSRLCTAQAASRCKQGAVLGFTCHPG